VIKNIKNYSETLESC